MNIPWYVFWDIVFMKTLDDLWYVLGTVHVALKYKVFQPSNTFRNTKELVYIANYLEDGVSAKDPVMFLYSAVVLITE